MVLIKYRVHCEHIFGAVNSPIVKVIFTFHVDMFSFHTSWYLAYGSHFKSLFEATQKTTISFTEGVEKFLDITSINPDRDVRGTTPH